jgi:Mrr N-terminal domain
MRHMPVELDDDERRALRRKARAAVLAALDALDGEVKRASLLARALELGGFTPRELDAEPPPAAASQYGRLVDHNVSWALTNLKRDGLVENPRWGVWRLAGAATERPESVAADELSDDRLAELRAMPYRRYLRTPEWRRTRAAALHRAGYACSLDIAHTDDLEVHHRTYERLGQELATDLTVLCDACHGRHHEHFGLPRRQSEPPPDARPQSLLRRLFTR